MTITFDHISFVGIIILVVQLIQLVMLYRILSLGRSLWAR